MTEETPVKIRDHKNYFPRSMRFADNKGNVYEDALAVLSFNTDSHNKRFEFVAKIYKSAEDFDYGLPPISEADGGVRRVVFTSDQFDRFVAANANAISANMNLVWSVFLSVKDAPDGTGNYKSFFAEAGEIILPESLA